MNANGDDQPITVFLLDDHDVVLRGIRDLINSQDDMQVVGEARTCGEARNRIPALRPQVAVLDVNLPDGNGIEICREMQSTVPELRSLIFTAQINDDALLEAILAGASGYVLKQIRENSLLEAIRTVAAGGSLLDPQASAQVMDRLRKAAQTPKDPLESLNPQERRILELIGEGLTNRQIGEEMFLAEKTIKNYVSSLLAKLGMQRRTQVAAFAAKLPPRDT